MLDFSFPMPQASIVLAQFARLQVFAPEYGTRRCWYWLGQCNGLPSHVGHESVSHHEPLSGAEHEPQSKSV